jgi:hypothetical protein
MRPRAAWLALSLLAAPAAADVAVRVVPTTPGQPAKVEVVARAAPLNEVLDRLARQIGMKVVYDGAQPRQIVTLSVSGRPAAETVLAVLEGQGLNFALLGDASGAGAQTLLVTGAVPATAGSAGSVAPVRAFPGAVRRPMGQPPGSSPDAMETDSDDAEEEEPPFEPPANETQQPAAGQEAAPGPAPQPDAPAGVPVPGQKAPQPQPAGPTTSPFPVSPFAPQPTPYTPQPFPPTAPGAPVGPPSGPQQPGQQPPQQPPQEPTPP